MFGWGNFDFPTIPATKLTREEQDEIKRKKEIADMIEQKGVGTCMFCEEEIVKNVDMPGSGHTWESEFYVGFCPVSKTAKHSPLVRWNREDGVHNA